MIRNWVIAWLKYLGWYHTVALSQFPRLSDFFEGPVINTSWKVSKVNHDLVRFGLLWKCYDMVSVRGLSWRPNILESGL